MMRAAFRGAGVAIAVLGAIDPSIGLMRSQPVPVRFQVIESPGLQLPSRIGGSRREEADTIVRRLTGNLAGFIDASDTREPAAIVLIGDAPPPAVPVEGVPISTVSMAEELLPNVRLVQVDDPPPAAMRQAVIVDAEFEAIGMSGKTSVFVVQDRGTVVARTEHRWTGERERFRARLRYAPPVAGLHWLTVGAQPLDEERTAVDNAADASVLVVDRPLRVLAYEPRPSWNAAFVRRALEADRRFDVAALVRSSRGVMVRSGRAPAVLTSAALEDFDVITIGAPEELRATELDALSTFAYRRGGGVVFLPDRRPSGPYRDVLPAAEFEEVLLENPVPIAADISDDVRASELLLARRVRSSASTVAAIDRRGERAPVSVTWVHGAGQMVLWGALDAWRFRSDADGAFSRFWQATAADLAIAAPERVDVSISPRLAAPNERVVIRATVRSTEFAAEGARVVLPPVGAAVRHETGSEQPLRLWPTAESGVFEGETTAAEAGRHDVRVMAGASVGRAAFLVGKGLRRAIAEDPGALKLIAGSTGGVAVRGDEVATLEDYLRKLSRGSERTSVRPMRSLWWMVPFAGCLCAEWALRRRRGLT